MDGPSRPIALAVQLLVTLGGSVVLHAVTG